MDGVAWEVLGAGSPMAGGWRLADVELSGAAFLRGRGYVAGGKCAACSWYIEQVVSTVPLPLVIRVNNPGFGFVDGRFGFEFEGPPGLVVIESSEDLLQRLPLSTNSVDVSSGYFTDPEPAGSTQRFYRLRVP